MVRALDLRLTIRSSNHVAQCELLYRELQEYSRQCELEQKYRLSGHVPRPDDYFSLRLGTSAVRAFCRICE